MPYLSKTETLYIKSDGSILKEICYESGTCKVCFIVKGQSKISRQWSVQSMVKVKDKENNVHKVSGDV